MFFHCLYIQMSFIMGQLNVPKLGNCDLMKQIQVRSFWVFCQGTFVFLTIFLLLLCSIRIVVLKSLDFDLVRSKWQKIDEHPILLVKDNDHTIYNVVFKCLVWVFMVVHQLHFLLNLWFICMFMKMLLILCPYHHNHYQHQNNLHQNTCQVDKKKLFFTIGNFFYERKIGLWQAEN